MEQSQCHSYEIKGSKDRGHWVVNGGQTEREGYSGIKKETEEKDLIL